jgi:hypothetical protein
MTQDVLGKIVSRIDTANVAFSKKTLFTSKLDLCVRKKLVKCYIWRITLCGSETWAVQNFEVWCWERMEKISWTDRVRS